MLLLSRAEMLLSQISKQTAFELHGLLENKCFLAHLARGDFLQCLQRRGVFSLGSASMLTVSFSFPVVAL